MIAAVLRARHQRAGRLAAVHARPSADPVTRVAVVASRRVGGAVQRNRAKRLLREVSRGLPWVSNHDVVLVARAGAARSSLAEVHSEVADLAAQLDLLQEVSV